MLRDAVDRAVTRTVGHSLLAVVGLAAAFGVGLTLAYGTNGLVALGLSREIAGSILTVLVVAACLYGLYWFATRMIDW